MLKLKKTLPAFLILFLLMIACNTTSSKNPDSAERTKLFDQLDVQASAKWTSVDNVSEEIDSGYPNVTIKIESKVEKPDIDQYPVIELEHADINDTILTNIFRHFTQEYTLYDGRYTYTISEIKAAIAKLEDPLCTDPNADESLNNLYEELKTACNEYEWKRFEPENCDISNTSCFYKRNSGNYMQYITQSGALDIYVHQISGTIQDEFSVFQGDAMDGEQIGTKINPSISFKDALKIAEDFLADVHVSDLKLVTSTKARQLGYKSINNYGLMSEGWLLTYEPIYRGLSGGILIPTEYQNFEGIQYSSSKVPEYLNIYVDEYGISYLIWTGHSQEKRAVNENVQLLNFNDIYSVIVNQLLKVAASCAADQHQWQIHVDRILLGGAPLSFPENGSSTYYQPTWYIQYRITTSEWEFPFRSSFMISAISGDLIEPREN